MFVKTFFFRDRLKNFCEDPFFFGKHLRLCPWPRAFLSLASRVSVLGKAVLGLGFLLCPLPWPRALCPRLHLWCEAITACWWAGGSLTGRPKVPSLSPGQGDWINKHVIAITKHNFNIGCFDFLFQYIVTHLDSILYILRNVCNILLTELPIRHFPHTLKSLDSRICGL